MLNQNMLINQRIRIRGAFAFYIKPKKELSEIKLSDLNLSIIKDNLIDLNLSCVKPMIMVSPLNPLTFHCALEPAWPASASQVICSLHIEKQLGNLGVFQFQLFRKNLQNLFNTRCTLYLL